MAINSFCLTWMRSLAAALVALTVGCQAVAQSAGNNSGANQGVGPMALQKAQQAEAQASAPAGEQAGAGQLSTSDYRFVMNAAASGLFEVEAARLASSRATDPSLQRYAAMLLEDHAVANEDLRRLASGKGLQVPTRPSVARQRTLDRMSRLSGADFDHEFLRSVAMHEHQQDLRLFQAASRDARDPELKAWASKMVPTLERHLSQARQLPVMPMAGPGMGPGARPGMGPGMGLGGSSPGNTNR